MALPDESRESFREVSPSDLLRSGFELMCRSVVLVQHGLQGRDRHVEVVSHLEHQLSEATQDLKESLAANTDLTTKIAKEATEKELAQNEAVELRRQLEAEKARAATEIDALKKLVEERAEKLSTSVAEVAALQAAKDRAEAELDENYEEAEELLKQCFEKAMRQAHALYGGPPTAGSFDLDCEVYQGRLMPSAEAAALAAREGGPAGT